MRKCGAFVTLFHIFGMHHDLTCIWIHLGCFPPCPCHLLHIKRCLLLPFFSCAKLAGFKWCLFDTIGQNLEHLQYLYLNRCTRVRISSVHTMASPGSCKHCAGWKASQGSSSYCCTEMTGLQADLLVWCLAKSSCGWPLVTGRQLRSHL